MNSKLLSKKKSYRLKLDQRDSKIQGKIRKIKVANKADQSNCNGGVVTLAPFNSHRGASPPASDFAAAGHTQIRDVINGNNSLKIVQHPTKRADSRGTKSKFFQKGREIAESHHVNRNFCERLKLKAVTGSKLADLRCQILEEVECVNTQLAGGNGFVQKMSSSSERKGPNVVEEGNKENGNRQPFGFNLWPKSKWVFHTPPNRKLNLNRRKANGATLKPVVIETVQNNKSNKRVIYRMNEKINVDLNKCTNKQKIEIDRRFLVEDNKDCMEYGSSDENEDPSQELENHFLSLTSRPKKAKIAYSRINSVDGTVFRPLAADCSNSQYVNSETPTKFNVTEDVEMLNDSDTEESFTFKFSLKNNENNISTTTETQLFDNTGREKKAFHFQINNN